MGVYGETYWQRLRTLAYEVDLPMDEFALRFSAFAPGVCSAIVGTANPDHVRHNAVIVQRGPLPADVLEHVRARWDAACHESLGGRESLGGHESSADDGASGEWGGEV